jgi:hypothetical protein
MSRVLKINTANSMLNCFSQKLSPFANYSNALQTTWSREIKNENKNFRLSRHLKTAKPQQKSLLRLKNNYLK